MPGETVSTWESASIPVQCETYILISFGACHVSNYLQKCQHVQFEYIKIQKC